jgi:hypothetical protein
LPKQRIIQKLLDILGVVFKGKVLGVKENLFSSHIESMNKKKVRHVVI